ncbi:DUF1566 domain-containing protein [Pseudomonas corrugata]|uniref:DUF1566 domain-containing protein n=1 Tax=Pseudomonas corrugata TaxID=47879 RepID=UPI003D8128E0
MKPEMITLKYGDASIKMPTSSLAKLAMASVFAQVLPPAANVQPVEPLSVPALGEYWPGQGGLNGGFVPARGNVPAHYLIFAKADIGEHQWGPRNTDLPGTSKTDGKLNTELMCFDDKDYPAANACAEYAADGHNDFYLPAAAELYQAWANDLISEGVYWSSSQRSAYFAFGMYFVGGSQNHNDKGNELRVRPVRRFFI